MEIWFLILISLSLSLLVKAIFDHFIPSSNPQKKAQSPPQPSLPPGPPTLPILGNMLLLRKPISELEPILRSLHSKLGPMVTLRIGSRPIIFISDRSLAHQALVQNGAVFSERPGAAATSKIFSSNQHTISSLGYGPMWRLFRRNLTSQILHPSRIKSYSHARKWVLQVLVDRFQSTCPPIHVMDHFRYAMFCLLVMMCFGDKLQEDQIKEIERVHKHILSNAFRFNILNFFPRITKILLPKKWGEFMQLRKGQEDVIIPLIRAREKLLKEEWKKDEHVLTYVDTLFSLELPDEKRKLNEAEMVSLCGEFLNAGTDTTFTTLQWIMANLVKYPQVQKKLFAEIKNVLSNKNDNPREVEADEEDLKKMKYLKAVVLEGLRRHPPGHFVLPHAVSEDVLLGDHLVPKNGTVNFMLADMGWDPAIWEDPMEFRPERFLGKEEDFDVTGSKGIKMMPFGIGRRICPGYGLAILHLEYFVANLVWRFEWKPVEGVGVDLTEKQEFTIVMKEPLLVQLVSRFRGN